MDKHRITMSDLVIGEPLPWDVYNDDGHLLLRKGKIVEFDRQVEILLERGLFVNKSAKKTAPSVATPQEAQSVLRLINMANKRLERLLSNLAAEENAQEKLLEIAKIMAHAVQLDADVALATILLNQETGSYPVRHCIDTSIVAILIVQALNKPTEEIHATAAAALTMNVAMLRLQEKLQDTSAPLSAAELQEVRSHPQESVKLLRQAGVTNEEWLSYVLMHHENEDGSGYPLGKTGDGIPMNAKIITIADRYCARVSIRNYRKSLLPNAALRDILMADKKNIDPALITTFIRELGTYPNGTFVRLESGEIGVVTSRGASSTTPYVHALIGPRGAPLAIPIKRDTSKQLHSIRDVLTEEQANMRFTMQQLWGAVASL